MNRLHNRLQDAECHVKRPSCFFCIAVVRRSGVLSN